MPNVNNPLQNIESRLISSFMFNSKLFDIYYLDKYIFSIEEYGIIFEEMKNQYIKYHEVDYQKILQSFMNDNKMLDIVCSINDNAFSDHNIENDIKFINNEFRKRKMKELIYDSKGNDFEEIISMIEDIPNYYHNTRTGEILTEEEIFNLVTNEKSHLIFDLSFMKDFEISFNTLNTIGARTGKGKTAFSLNLLLDLGKKYRCLYFNLENPKDVIYQRLIQIDSRLTKNQIKEQKNENKVSDSIYRIRNGLKIKLYDSREASNIETIKRIISEETRNDFCIVFLDNINNIDTLRRFTNLREKINHITKQLLNIKASMNCVIFALAQLRRSDTNSRPTEKDLKESGSIEEDSDNVFLLHDISDDKTSINATYELITPKSRNDINRQKELIFKKGYQIFEERPE